MGFHHSVLLVIIHEILFCLSVANAAKQKKGTIQYTQLSNRHKFIVGTIAGDDTIFIACRTMEFATELTQELKKLI